MNKKLAYSIVFGILGAIVAFFLLYFLSALIAAILFITYGDNPWPQWSNVFSNDQFVMSILAIFASLGFIVGAVFGTKYVAKFKEAKQWLFRALIISAISIGIALYMFITQNRAQFLSRQQEVNRARVISAAGKIKSINVNESQENLTFIISTQAALLGKYELSLAFDTYLAKNFFIYNKKVFIDKPESQLEAVVTFSDLKHALRKGLASGGRINSFDQKFGSQDEVLVEVKLRSLSLEAPTYEDLKTVKGKMSFICYKDSCEFDKIGDRFFQLE